MRRFYAQKGFPDVVFAAINLGLWVGFVLLLFLGNPSRHNP